MTRSSRLESPKAPDRLPSEQLQRKAGLTVARFGQINFINCLPLTYPLLRAQTFEDVDFTLGTPAELNHAFSQGGLDLGAMSSFFFLEQSDFTLVPSISIASIGAVGSVLFFADRQPSELAGTALAITADSATSVNLLKILFAESYGFVPRFEVTGTPGVGKEHAGALVIGDKALNSDTTWSKELVRIDMGQWWYESFGLPMVFGCWAARNSWIDANRHRFETICKELRALFDRGLGLDFQKVLDEAEKTTGHPRPRLEHYYRNELNFDLTDKHRQGLSLYAKLCVKHGLLQTSAKF
jgi:chorismate dehydratase